MSTTVAVDKVRAKALAKMTPATRAIAEEYDGKMGKAAVGLVVFAYGLGTRVREMQADEKTYGQTGVKDLAEYLNTPGGDSYLYRLKQMAEVFSKEYVQEKSSVAMANGHRISVDHWLWLAQVEDERNREKLLALTFKESWSSADLEMAIRAGAGGKTRNARGGGRKPKISTNVLIALQSTWQLSNKFSRFAEEAKTKLFDVLDDIAPDKVNDNLVEKAKTTLETLDEVIKSAKEMKDRLKPSVEHLMDVRAKAAEKTAEEYDEGEAAKPAKKKAAAAAPSGNGTGKKKKLKKKSKKPVAAV